jgi:hypothetical protein
MKKIALMFLYSFLFVSCEKEYDSGHQIYFNSFESLSDTIGWRGYAFNFAADAPKPGGKKSLAISGGCIFPHAQYTLNSQNTDCYIILKFWGKNLSNGGGVYLGVNRIGYGELGFNVSAKDWTLYESQNSLFCPANTSLTLGVTAGGILGSEILIDMLEIRKVK